MSKHNENHKLIFANVSVTYSRGKHFIEALRDVNFSIQDKEFVCVLGPSGCGKTTILNLIGGFINPTSGNVFLGGCRIIRPDARCGFVFQQHSLFPWKTARKNIELGLRMKGYSKKRCQEIVDHYLQCVGLQEFADYYPFELSVGMQQRVGIARAYANNPEILLMDEPFASLDAQSRFLMHQLLIRIWSQHLKTIIFITHDIDEAILLADRILLLSPRPGTIKEEIEVTFPRPRSQDVFLNSHYMNLRKKLTESFFKVWN